MAATDHRAAAGPSSGSNASASARSAAVVEAGGDAAPVTARVSTRRTFVSSTACRSPNANAATAAAV